MKKFNYELVNEKDVPAGVMIPDEGWAIKINKAIVGINELRFADEENEDGTFDIQIDYELLEGELSDEDIDTIGPICIEILEESLKIQEMKELMNEARANRK